MSIDVAQVVASDATVSDKIRLLAGAGFERAEIARLLNKRYQHVRNVLEGDRVGARRRTPPGRAIGAAPTKPLGLKRTVRLVIGTNGEVTLPADLLDAMGLKAGESAFVNLEGDELKLVSGPVALKRVQAMVRAKVPAGVSLVDELIADRRREAIAEERG